MGMVVTLFLAVAAMVVGYAAFGQGGGVAGMVFFGILIIGAAIRTLKQVQSS
jgi:prepilin signal peptidase PulO-like enzyme (type II secretory pathway)